MTNDHNNRKTGRVTFNEAALDQLRSYPLFLPIGATAIGPNPRTVCFVPSGRTTSTGLKQICPTISFPSSATGEMNGRATARRRSTM